MATSQPKIPSTSRNDTSDQQDAEERLRQVLAKFVDRHIERATGPLRDEIANLRQRLDDLERRQDPT